MSDAIIGTGIRLQAGDGASPENFVSVAELVSVTPPSQSRNEIDVSTHNEGVEAKILGMLRQGQVAGMVNWVPTDVTHMQMRSDLKNNVKRNWRITYPPDHIVMHTFPARVQKFEIPDVTTDAPLQGNIALTLDGNITEAP